MKLPKDFAVVILTHKRAGRVFTIPSLRKAGYTKDIYLLCDTEDPQLEEYKQAFKDSVLVFSKDDWEGRFDKMDNTGNKACVVYARNAIYSAAKAVGLKYIAVLDDDYIKIEYRINATGGYHATSVKNCDDLFAAYLEYFIDADLDALCFAQGGDYIGGKENNRVRDGFKVSRKMMNLYFFDVDKPVPFMGTINEDLTASTLNGQTGRKIITSFMNSIVQKETQQNAGGLTDIYLELGTFVKSFYSVMAAPSCVKVAPMGDSALRLHHSVAWRYAVPKIIRQEHKKEAPHV